MKCQVSDSHLPNDMLYAATSMLTNTSVVSAISFGFNDSNYYAKVFRKYKGCSPTQYRQSNKKFQNTFDATEIINIPNTCKNHH